MCATPRGLRAARRQVRAIERTLAVSGKWAGTFTRDGDTCFWNVSGHRSGHRRTIVVQLNQEKYQRLYLTVTDPRATADAINGALSRRL